MEYRNLFMPGVLPHRLEEPISIERRKNSLTLHEADVYRIPSHDFSTREDNGHQL